MKSSHRNRQQLHDTVDLVEPENSGEASGHACNTELDKEDACAEVLSDATVPPTQVTIARDGEIPNAQACLRDDLAGCVLQYNAVVRLPAAAAVPLT